MSVGGGAVNSWSSTQSTIALSSGEAEYYALTRAAAEALGFQSLCSDLGWSMAIRVWVDSTAAKAIASRTGLGRVRHLEVRYLWVQGALKDGRFKVLKIPGKVNPGDILTKPQDIKEIEDLLGMVGILVPKCHMYTVQS